MNSQHKCCCGCSGVGVPCETQWTQYGYIPFYQIDWQSGISYAVGMLLRASDGYWYVCDVAHTSSSTTEPGVGADWASYWTLGERQISCMYVEVSGLQYKECFEIWGNNDDGDNDLSPYRMADPSAVGQHTVADKMLIRQQIPPDGNGEETEYPPCFYSKIIGTSSFYTFKCNCTCPPEVVISQANADLSVGGVSIQHIIAIEVGSSTVTANIYGIPYPLIVGIYTELDCDDPIPGTFLGGHAFLPIYHLFTGSVAKPANWVDTDGDPASDLTITNDFSTSDIGNVVSKRFSDQLYVPSGVVMGGGGTVKIVAPFSAGWEDTIGNALSSAGSVSAPSDGECDTEPEPPKPPIPPCPPGYHWDGFKCVKNDGGGGGGGGGGDPPPPPPPPPRRSWRKVNKCSGGFSGYWVDASQYAAGEVLKISLNGEEVCVVIGELKVSSVPPGPLLGSVLNDYGDRGCAECGRCWKLVGCAGTTIGTIFTDIDLTPWVGKVVEVLYTDTLGDLDPPQCASVGTFSNCPQTEFVVIGAEFDDCDDPACDVDPCAECNTTQPTCSVTASASGCIVGTVSGGSVPFDAYDGSPVYSGAVCAWYWTTTSGPPNRTVKVYYMNDDTYDVQVTLSGSDASDVAYYEGQDIGGISCNRGTNRIEGSVTVPFEVLGGTCSTSGSATLDLG